MDTFQIKRHGEETQENNDNELDLLQKLKQKIAAKKDGGEVKKRKVSDSQESEEPAKKKRKKKKKKTEDVDSGFTKLGVFDEAEKVKVRRVLPKWLAEPDIVSVDLGDQQMPVEEMKQLDSSLLSSLQANGIKYFFPVQRQVIPHLLESGNILIYVLITSTEKM